MTRGRVKWFSQMKGYGFLEGDSGQDVYVHYTAVSSQLDNFNEGTCVEFDVLDTERGLEATNVRVMEAAPIF